LNLQWWRRYEGQVIAGTDDRYRLDILLGNGAFGGVFRAALIDSPQADPVALKLIYPDSDNKAGQLSELIRGLKMRHANLIHCSDAGMATLEKVDFLYLAMEIADETLETRLARGSLTTAEAIDLARQMSSALAFLHDERRLAHRDLKPANILRVAGTWKLSDYGILRQVGAGAYAKTGKAMGTLSYMPPESFDGVVAPTWDIWSLGVILVEALTGKRPFTGTSEAELMAAILSKEPEFQRPIPAPLDVIVRDCLKRDRKLRIRAAAILELLLPPTTPPAPMPPPPVRNPPAAKVARNLGEVKVNAKDGLRYVWIPPGIFMMGCSHREIANARMTRSPRTRCALQKASGLGRRL
jgi:eukaryotic-like serine/threonine-protein kinase